MKIYTQKLYVGNRWENMESHQSVEQAIADAVDFDKMYGSFTNGYNRVVKVTKPGGGNKGEKVTVLYPAP